MKRSYLLFIYLLLQAFGVVGQVKTDAALNTEITNLIVGRTYRFDYREIVDRDLITSKVNRQDYLTVTASGTNTYTATPAPALTSYVAGYSIKVIFTNANSGPSTINLNGLGAIPLVKEGSVALGANDIKALEPKWLIYDGTSFHVVGGTSGPPAWLLGSGGTLTGPNNITGTTTNTIKLTFDNMAGTRTNGAGLWLINNTPATAGVTQYSPSIVLQGSGWNSSGGTASTRSFEITATTGPGTNALAEFQVTYNGAAFVSDFQNSGGAFQRRVASSSAVFSLNNTNTAILTLNTTSSGQVVVGTGLTFDSNFGGITGSTSLQLKTGLNNRYFIGSTGAHSITSSPTTGGTYVTYTQSPGTSGTNTGFLWTGGAHTNQAASTELLDINYNLNRTVTFNTGALATQRAFLIQAPTYGFVGSSTITNAYTLYVDGAPIAGTNATITNPFAAYFGGKVQFTPSATYAGINMGSVGSHPSTLTQGDLYYTNGYAYIRNGSGPYAIALYSGTSSGGLPYYTTATTGFTVASALTYVPANGLSLTSGNLAISGATGINTSNVILNSNASAVYDTNLILLGSTAQTGGFMFGSNGAFTSSNGPFFAGRGNTYSAFATQRGNISIYAGNPTTPAVGEGSVVLGTGADLKRLEIDKDGNIIIGGGAITAGSVLVDFKSTSKGLLMPRVTNIASVTTPVAGMIAYDAATNKFNFRENAAWVQMGAGGFYQTVQNSGTGLTQRAILNAVHGLTAVDNGTKTDIRLGGTVSSGGAIILMSDNNFEVRGIAGSLQISLITETGYPNISLLKEEFTPTDDYLLIRGSNANDWSFLFKRTSAVWDMGTTYAALPAYLADYSGSFTARNWIDKGYADTRLTGLTFTNSPTTNYVPQYNGTNITWVAMSGGDMVLATAQTSTGKKSFTTDATNAGLRIVPLAGNPSVLVDGDIWLNSAVLNYRGSGQTWTVAKQVTGASNQISYYNGSDGSLNGTDMISYGALVGPGGGVQLGNGSSTGALSGYRNNGTNGGDLIVQGGDGGTTNRNGGSLNLLSGVPTGSGTEGNVNVQTRPAGKLGFFNATAVIKQSAVTTAQGIADALTAYGLLPASTISSSSGITVGTTTITSGTSGKVPYNNAGVYAEGEFLRQAAGVYWIDLNVNSVNTLAVRNANTNGGVASELVLLGGANSATIKFYGSGYSSGGLANKLGFFNTVGNTFFSLGTFSLGIGTDTPARKLNVAVEDATTTTVLYAQRLTRTSSATPASGIGVGMEFEWENPSSVSKVGASIYSTYTSGGNGSELSELSFSIIDAGANTRHMYIDPLKIWTFTHMEISETNSTTSTVASMVDLVRQTTGTAATGIGVSISFVTENASTVNKYGSTIESVSTDVTNGTEDFDLVFKNMAGGANAAEKLRITSTGVLGIKNGTAPSSSPVDAVQIYAEDVSSSSELKVRDEAGNITTLSPHNFSLIPEGPSEEMAWSYYSEKDGKRINIDMLKAIRLLEKLTGEKLVHITESKINQK